jgi:hypothetical protein
MMPPVLNNNPRLPVVDGFLNNNPDSRYIKLTFTRNLWDTAPAVAALNATLMVEDDQNTLIPVHEKGQAVYGNLLSLRTSEKYRLIVTVSDGRKYRSDYVVFKQTLHIDCISRVRIPPTHVFTL